MDEIWKAIPSYPKYQASDLGRVSGPKGILTPSLARGYQLVKIYNGNGEWKVAVHRLVLLSFSEMPSPKHQVDHINEIKHDNCLSNLQWVTRSENLKLIKARRAGPVVRLPIEVPKLRKSRKPGTGTKGPRKFTVEQIRRIKLMRSQGHSYSQIQSQIKISAGNLTKIFSGLNWKHVTL